MKWFPRFPSPNSWELRCFLEEILVFWNLKSCVVVVAVAPGKEFNQNSEWLDMTTQKNPKIPVKTQKLTREYPYINYLRKKPGFPQPVRNP